MPLMITKKKRLHRLERKLPDSSMLVLTFREFKDQAEREKVDFDLAGLRNYPGETEEERDRRFEEFLAGVGSLLLHGWEGPVDENEQPTEPTEEAKAIFFADEEYLFLWRSYIFRYIFPAKASTSSAVEGEKRVDPQS